MERLLPFHDDEVPRLAILAAGRQSSRLYDLGDHLVWHGSLPIRAHGQDRANRLEDFHVAVPFRECRRIILLVVAERRETLFLLPDVLPRMHVVRVDRLLEPIERPDGRVIRGELDPSSRVRGAEELQDPLRVGPAFGGKLAEPSLSYVAPAGHRRRVGPLLARRKGPRCEPGSDPSSLSGD